MAEKHQDQEFLQYIVENVVNNPKDIKIDRIVDERGVLLSLQINPADMGYIIGKQGQTARSIRTLLKIVGAKANARVNLKIIEPEGSMRRPRTEETSSAGTSTSIDIDDELSI
jgi:hypothetical protein